MLQHRMLALGLAATLGCATSGIDREEFPEAPIAFLSFSQGQSLSLAESHELRKNPDELRLESDSRQIGGQQRSVTRLRLRPEELRGELQLLSPRTGEAKRVEAAPRGAWPLDWSPDGRRLLFAAPRDGMQLFALDRADDHVLPVTRQPGEHVSGSFGPGQALVFTRLEQGEAGLTERVFLSRDGVVRPLSPGPADRDPIWSPDGLFVVFVRRLPNGEFVMVRAEDLHDPRFRQIGRGVDPTFTPDGQWIIYSRLPPRNRRPRGRQQLWRMRPDGTGKQALGKGVGDEQHPSVSPDGRFVAYVVSEGGRRSLYVMRLADGALRLMHPGGDGIFPIWD